MFFEKDEDRALPENNYKDDQHGSGKYDKNQSEGEGLVFDFDFARQEVDFCHLFHSPKQGNALFMRWGKMPFSVGGVFPYAFPAGSQGNLPGPGLLFDKVDQGIIGVVFGNG